MNCLEFRRQLGIDPQSAGAEFVRHRHDCARCAEASARAAEFEAALRRALSVEPSPQLAESILLAQATQQQRRHRQLRRGSLFALAASLVLAIGIGVGMRVEANPLSAQAVTHLHGELAALGLTTPLPDDEVRAAFATRGIRLAQAPPAGVVYAACCPMGRHRTVHMVMPASNDPVTVIYVVDERLDARNDFARDGWQGRSVPVGRGTLILLARTGAQFDRLEREWRAALQG